MAMCKKKITSDRAAFNDLIFGGILGADLKDKAFAKLCDSLVLKKKNMCYGLNNVEG